MELFKSKITIILILLIWGITYIGALENNNLAEDNKEPNSSANA